MLMRSFGVSHILFSSGKNLKTWVLCPLLFASILVFVLNLVETQFLVNTWGKQTVLPLELALELYSTLFLVLVVVVSTSVYVWGGTYMTSKHKLKLFYISLSVFVGSMLLLTLSKSLLVLFLGWEGLGVSSFLLIMFYQNWMSAKGSLLTLLTNRLGDGVLMLALSYWMSCFVSDMKTMEGVLFSTILVLVSCTKSAQWPFINWLPAAMAAPTPVSALVHSSTLVTAGIWMLLRFSWMCVWIASSCFFLGLVTLLLASMHALAEKDGKKVVALSTLSQLGMMYLAFSLGNFVLCLFHILVHALAKANLFMVVGDLLHKSFSGQDMRSLSLGSINFPLMLSLTISMISLTGFLFSSGFFSKEQIMMSQQTLMTSILFSGLIVLISGLTLAYCFNLLYSFTLANFNSQLISTSQSKLSTTSMVILGVLTVITGWTMSFNLSIFSILLSSTQGWLWTLPSMGVLLVWVGLRNSFKMSASFSSQNKSVDLLALESLKRLSQTGVKLESVSTEIFFLLTSVKLGTLVKVSFRVLLIAVSLLLLLILL